MTPFTYARAADVADAVSRLAAAAPDARYLGGGTNLVDLMRERIERPSALVDVTGLSHEIAEQPDGGLLIGAAARNTAVAEHRLVRMRYPMLARAILAGASAQIRNMATTGGNLLQRTRCTYFYDDQGSRCNKRRPGQGCDAIGGFNRNHAILGASQASSGKVGTGFPQEGCDSKEPSCIAVHPSDMCVALAALDAEVLLEGRGGARSLAFTDFHRLPGDRPDIDSFLDPGELITAIALPPLPLAANSTYRKVRDRSSYAFALVSVAAALEIEEGRVKDVRLALGGVAHKPWRAHKAEAALRGQPANASAFAAAAQAELADAHPLKDNGFKVELARRTIAAVLGELAGSKAMTIREDAKQLVQGAIQSVIGKAVALAPDSWMPGGTPDPLIRHQHGHVGKPVSRIDGPLKVAGAARFAAEFPIDDMVYAALAYSNIARGRIAAIDSSAAEAAPGVVGVMTHLNAPRLDPPPVFLSGAKAAGGDSLPVMQDDRIHWNGEPIAVVLAESQEQADHGISLLHVTYEAEQALTGFEAARAQGTRQGLFFGQPLHNEIGNAEAALFEAAARVDETYITPRHNHNAIELHGVTCAWQGDKLHIHDASQLVAHCAWSIAQMFGIAEEQVEVTSPFVGGGFGGKCLWQHQVLAAAASKWIGRPVRLVLSREGVYRIVGGRSQTDQRVALGADPDGRLKAIVHEGVTAKTNANVLPEPFILPTRSAYAAETMKLDVQTVALDMLSNTFMRAPGESVGTFALESAMDELADLLGIDPIELRLRNEPDKDPLTGLPFSSRHIAEAWRAGAERFGWSKRNPRPGMTRDGEDWVGIGCAQATYPYYRMPGGAARITLTRSGPDRIGATIDIAAHEMGMGTATAQVQVAAERLGLGLEDIIFNYGDSTLPGVVLAGGSQQTASIGASVIAAHRILVAELLKLAGNDSPLAGLDPDAIGSRDSGLCKLDEPDRHESYASILTRARRDSLSVVAEASMPMEGQHWSMHSHGAMFCEVRVDAVTGEPRVSRFLGSFDCGRIINPKTAASQFRGGIIMGLGLALMEETQFDERSGRIMNPSLAEYHVPVHLDVPEIDVIWTDIPDPHTPMGARGIGEIGITGTGAAVANAIFNATGRRVRELPITLDKLM